MEFKALVVIISQAILGFLLTLKLTKNASKQFPLNLNSNGIWVFGLLLVTIGFSYSMALDNKDQQISFEQRLNDTASLYKTQIIDTTKYFNNKIIDTVSKVKDIIVYLNDKEAAKDNSNQKILQINLGKIGNQIHELPVGKADLSVNGIEEDIERVFDSSTRSIYGIIPLAVWNSGSAPAKNLIIKSIAIKHFKNGYYPFGSTDISYELRPNFDLEPWNSVEVFRPLNSLILNRDSIFFGIKYYSDNYPEQFEMFFFNFRRSKQIFKYEYQNNLEMVALLKNRGFL